MIPGIAQEGPPLQAGDTHDLVHEEGGTRHVPHALQDGDDEEHDDDLGDEGEHGAHTPDDAVAQEPGDERMGLVEPAVHQLPQIPETSFDGVLEGGRPGEDRLEEEEHDREEHDGAGDGAQQDLVHGRGDLVVLGRLVVRRGQHRVGPGGDLVGVGGRRQRGALPVLDLGELGAQVRHADAAVSDDSHGRDAQGLSESGDVEPTRAAAEFVGHGDHQAGGQLQGEGLGDEVHAALQGRGVDDDDQGVRGADRGRGPGEDVVDDLLVGADRVQGVGARQVLDGQGLAADLAGSHRPLDGDAGVVAGLGVQAGQGVVDGGLAGVGGAGQGDARGPCHQGLGAS